MSKLKLAMDELRVESFRWLRDFAVGNLPLRVPGQLGLLQLLSPGVAC